MTLNDACRYFSKANIIQTGALYTEDNVILLNLIMCRWDSVPQR